MDLTLPQLQQLQLQIGKEIGRICDKHDLRYYLADGSLLGAVRHQGFIPWDDDLDFSMPLEDLLRFTQYAKQELSDRFVLQSWVADPNFGCPFVKIRMKNTFVQERAVPVSENFSGVWVDIFPLLPFPEKKATNLYMRRLRLWERAYHLKCGYDLNSITDSTVSRMLNRVLCLLGSLCSRQWMRKRYEKLLRPAEASSVTLECTSFFSQKLLFPSELYTGTVQLPFEDTQFPAPAGYIAYLERMYGDYMQLPPEEDRQKGHSLLVARMGEC